MSSCKSRNDHRSCSNPNPDSFWRTPAGLKTVYALLALNILVFLGWLAGCIYVTVDHYAYGGKNLTGLWALVIAVGAPLMGLCRYLYRRNKVCTNSDVPSA